MAKEIRNTRRMTDGSVRDLCRIDSLMKELKLKADELKEEMRGLGVDDPDLGYLTEDGMRVVLARTNRLEFIGDDTTILDENPELIKSRKATYQLNQENADELLELLTQLAEDSEYSFAAGCAIVTLQQSKKEEIKLDPNAYMRLSNENPLIRLSCLCETAVSVRPEATEVPVEDVVEGLRSFNPA